jgi:hypothetical protein
VKRTVLAGVVAAAAVGVWMIRNRPLAVGNYDFAYRDAEYLGPGQKLGGRAYVPPGARNHARLLVYLHGNNDGRQMHSGMGATDTTYDLRKIVPADTIVAAPSQTRNASGAGLWSGWNLDAFVDAVEVATGAAIDRSNVILMGHSGAGCNAKGGLLAPLGTIKPRLAAVVDVCAGPAFGNAFGKLGEQVPVRVFYQTGSWPRDFAGFQTALRGRAPLEKIATPPGESPHSAIVPIVARRVLG